ERGRSMTDVVRQYLSTVRPMHLEFVEPSKRYADIIIPEGGHNRVGVEMLLARVQLEVERRGGQGGRGAGGPGAPPAGAGGRGFYRPRCPAAPLPRCLRRPDCRPAVALQVLQVILVHPRHVDTRGAEPDHPAPGGQ
ncbi:MAG: hypothetical protein KJZ47_03920, partial [Gemmatimonadales bacterium]|nr:hypothetical protein [Gemmatimonadales bacterium]